MIRKFNFPPKLLQLVEYLHGTLGFGGSGEVDVPTLRKLCAEMESEHDAAQRSRALEGTDRLIEERAELIEALTHILSNQPIINVCGWYPEMSSARALLERLGAKEVE